ncbi:MAG: cytochrome c [Alphaproteobacteria bacterium]|nr:cytochrome c [Rhodospirillaceae bacterium]MBT6206212.1 cytochrome c [Rhodospirillaceae bacterium]MBT7648688.1 cytochrome c [Rhodospirillaceae bacterium]MDG2481994.1 cytochrome c [Alphaproteobacteria bacterium]
MKHSNLFKHLGTGAFCVALLLAPTLAMAQDQGSKAMSARQGFMQVVVWEAGPLFGMAKGDVPYDAEVAAANAANLNALVQYGVDRLFIPGTSKSEHPSDSRALMSIWNQPAEFAAAYGDMQAATAALAAEAGNGQEALAAAVGNLGKSCGNCHEDFRAEEY